MTITYSPLRRSPPNGRLYATQPQMTAFMSPNNSLEEQGGPLGGALIFSQDGKRYSWNPYSRPSVSWKAAGTASPNSFHDGAAVPPLVAESTPHLSASEMCADMCDAHSPLVVPSQLHLGPPAIVDGCGSFNIANSSTVSCETCALSRTMWQPFDDAQQMQNGPSMATFGQASFNSPSCSSQSAPPGDMHYANNYNTPLAGSLSYFRKKHYSTPGDPVAAQSSHGRHNAGPVWMCTRDKSAGQALGFKTMIPPPVPYTEALQRLTRAGTPNPAAVLTRILHRWYEMVQSVQCELHRLNPSDAYGDGSSEVDATPHGLCPPMPTEAEPEKIAEWAASCEEWWKAKFSGRPRFHGRHRAGASGNGHCARTGELRRGFTRRRSDDAPSGAEQRKD